MSAVSRASRARITKAATASAAALHLPLILAHADNNKKALTEYESCVAIERALFILCDEQLKKLSKSYKRAEQEANQ
jgi:hypothetical protein